MQSSTLSQRNRRVTFSKRKLGLFNKLTNFLFYAKQKPLWSSPLKTAKSIPVAIPTPTPSSAATYLTEGRLNIAAIQARRSRRSFLKSWGWNMRMCRISWKKNRSCWKRWKGQKRIALAFLLGGISPLRIWVWRILNSSRSLWKVWSLTSSQRCKRRNYRTYIKIHQCHVLRFHRHSRQTPPTWLHFSEEIKLKIMGTVVLLRVRILVIVKYGKCLYNDNFRLFKHERK